MQDGEGYTETGLTERRPRRRRLNGRDLAAEGMFEYGSRVGFWRLHARLPGARPADHRVRLRAGAGAQPAGRRGDQGSRASTSAATAGAGCKHFHAERGRGARAHRQGGEVAPADRRRGAGRLVLPLWTQRQHAPPAASSKAASPTTATTTATSCRSGRRSRASRTSSCPTRSPTTTASTPPA